MQLARGCAPTTHRSALQASHYVPDDIGLLNHARRSSALRHSARPQAILTRLFFSSRETARNVTGVFPGRSAPRSAVPVCWRAAARARQRHPIDPVARILHRDRRFRVPDRRACVARTHPVYHRVPIR